MVPSLRCCTPACLKQPRSSHMPFVSDTLALQPPSLLMLPQPCMLMLPQPCRMPLRRCFLAHDVSWLGVWLLQHPLVESCSHPFPHLPLRQPPLNLKELRLLFDASGGGGRLNPIQLCALLQHLARLAPAPELLSATERGELRGFANEVRHGSTNALLMPWCR
jgi:hypothetical protein